MFSEFKVQKVSSPISGMVFDPGGSCMVRGILHPRPGRVKLPQHAAPLERYPTSSH